MTYATLTQLKDYAPDDVAGLEDGELEPVLRKAERDVDTQLAGRQDPDTGLRVEPSLLEPWKAERLANAVCAQAQYRLVMGEDFFIRGQHKSARGPQIATTGKLPTIGPEVWRELKGTRLARVKGFGSIGVRASTAGDSLQVKVN